MRIAGRRSSLAVPRAIPVLVSVLALVVLSVQASATEAARRGRLDIDSFLTGLACVESGGRFDAANSKSGAFGKYQIMPRNWPAWSARYLGNRWARPTPRNQEFVARQRILDLYEKHGSWRVVAHWWLTGNGYADESLWTRHATKYVEKVIFFARHAATPALAGLLPERCFPADLPPPDIRSEPFPKVRVTGGAVNIRHGPGYENRAIGVVRRGARLPVLAARSDPRGSRWLRIGLADGSTGWISARFSKPD